MIETKAVVDEKLQKELNFRAFIISLIMLIIGIVGILALIILTAIKDVIFSELIDFSLLICFAMFFVIGVIGIINLKNVNKKAILNRAELTMQFDEEFYIIIENKHEEQVANAKIYYKDIVKTKETKNYFFIYPNSLIAHPILKSEISNENLQLIKERVKLAKKNKKQD